MHDNYNSDANKIVTMYISEMCIMQTRDNHHFSIWLLVELFIEFSVSSNITHSLCISFHSSVVSISQHLEFQDSFLMLCDKCCNAVVTTAMSQIFIDVVRHQVIIALCIFCADIHTLCRATVYYGSFNPAELQWPSHLTEIQKS